MPTRPGWVLLLLFAVSGGALAAEPMTAADWFQRGVTLFQAGRLEAARDALEQARTLGGESRSLIYNLGVVHYRLGEYNDASRAFRQLLGTADRDLARYNLGLVALADGRQKQARHWFALVRREAGDDTLRALAARQLDRQSTASGSEWQAYVSVGGGYDSNIEALPEAGASSDGGLFLDAVLVSDLTVPGGGQQTWSLQATYLGRDYAGWHSYDSDLIQLDGLWHRDAGVARAGVGLRASQSWFGHRAFETRYGPVLELRSPACGYQGFDQCGLTLSAVAVDAGSTYSAYSGDQVRLDANAAGRSGPWAYRVAYRWSRDDRDGVQVGPQFVSVSPTVNAVRGMVSRSVSGQVVVGVSGGFQWSRFPDDNRVYQGTTLVHEHREDHRPELGLFGERFLGPGWRLRAEWQFQDTSSTLDRYAYQRHTVLLTLEGRL
ncbi:tetratricopeptide repeat protein [Marinobacter sp. C2H3]|uniref:tetratricopeptide repeat protein n=1 Tax=Marinobacter sp. C2H3 TaxID=3119003 RepID=UPI00300ED539